MSFELKDLQPNLATLHERVSTFTNSAGKYFQDKFPKIKVSETYEVLKEKLDTGDSTLSGLGEELTKAYDKLKDLSEEGEGLRAKSGEVDAFNTARTNFTNLNNKIKRYLNGQSIEFNGTKDLKLDNAELVKAYKGFNAELDKATKVLESQFGAIRTDGILGAMKTHAEQLMNVGDEAERAAHGKAMAVRTVGLGAGFALMGHAAFVPKNKNTGEERGTGKRWLEGAVGALIAGTSLALGKAAVRGA